MNDNFENTKNAIVTYFKGVRSEWSKITWPERNQVVIETFFVIAIVFVFTIFAGVIMEGFDISPYFRLGFSGCVGFWAVRLYEILKAIFTKVEQNPDIILNKLERK